MQDLEHKPLSVKAAGGRGRTFQALDCNMAE